MTSKLHGDTVTISNITAVWASQISPQNANVEFLLGGINTTGSAVIDISTITIKQDGEEYTGEEGIRKYLLEVVGLQDKDFASTVLGII